jgi:hypothetical protein
VKQIPLLDIVEARLKELGCTPIPELVRAKITADFQQAAVELADRTILGDTFAKAVRDVFAPRKKAGNDHPELPFPAEV